MITKSFKIVINTPNKDLFQQLQKQLLYQNIELFYLPNLQEIKQFSRRIKPQISLIYIDSKPIHYRQTIRILEKISSDFEGWFFLILHPDVSGDKIRPVLRTNRFFMFNDTTDVQQIAHNILTLRDLEMRVIRLQENFVLEEHFNYCLKIIHQEHQLQRLFERLINYLPKVILMDYWAIFSVDPRSNQVKNFSQFIPPTRRNSAVLTPNLEKIAESWLKRGRAFALNYKEDRQFFKKLVDWGWPVKKIYFIPATVKDKPVGGLIVGNIQEKGMVAQDIRFLSDISKLIAQRILEVHLPELSHPDFDDFAEQLIVNRFSEDSLYYLSCKRINQITRGTSTVFWQYNKGFGFIFPKYFYCEEGSGGWQSMEKHMIFIEKEKFFNQLLSYEEIKTIDRVLEDSRLDDSTRKTFRQLSYNNLLVVPIRINSESIGTIIVNKKDNGGNFNAWEIHKVEEIVRKTQKVLEDTTVVKEAQLKLRQLSRIFELGNEIKLDLPLDAIIARIISSLRKALGWNDVAVLLVDEIGKLLRLSNLVGYTKKAPALFDFKKNVSIKKFEKFLAKCQPIGNSYFYDSHPLKEGSKDGEIFNDSVTGWHDDDILIVPIETRKKILGYMLVHDPVDRLKPTLEKVTPLEYYANQAAIAVENFQLYEKLGASEERYRSLAETMSLGLVTCNLKGEIIYTNPAFEKLVGFEQKAVLTKELGTFFSGDSRSRLYEISKKLLDETSDEKTRIENLELDLISSSGETIPVSVFAFPFFQHRKKVGFFIVLNDLRVLKHLERMKADFNSMIVHDLRSPMNVIQGFIELIRNRVVGRINAEQEELLDIAKENVKKVLTLIDNFLVASKIEVGKFSVDPKLNEINDLIGRVVENHRILFKNKNIQIQAELDKNLPLLFFDGLRIEQVLNNLLSNAIKFTPEKGKIQVKSSLLRKEIKGEEKFYACVSVKDNGPGIPPDRIDAIFDIYEQVEAENTFNPKGTGLGLAICREIVHLHGGDIWVESEINKGSTFFFTLPIEPTIEKIIK